MEAKNFNVRQNGQKKNNKGNVLGGALGAAIGTIVGGAAGTVGAAVLHNFDGQDDEDIEVVDSEVAVAEETATETQQEASAQPTAEAEATPAHHATAQAAPVHHAAPVAPTAEAEIYTPEPEVQPTNTAEAVPASDTNTSADVRVISFQTVTTDDGSQMDVAEVVVNGQDALIVDVNRDGWADGLITDANGDGNISEDEIISLEGTDVRIPMQELAQAAEQPAEEDPASYASNNNEEVIVADAALTVTPETDDAYIEAHDSEPMPDYINDANVSDVTSEAYYASNDLSDDTTADVDMGGMV